MLGFSLLFPILFFGVFATIIAAVVRNMRTHSKAVGRMLNTAFESISDLSESREEPDRTAAFLTEITADFPDFAWEDLRTRIQNTVRSALLARARRDLSLLTEDASQALRDQVELQIADDRHGIATEFDGVRILSTKIVGYRNQNGSVAIDTETKLSATRKKTQDGRLLSSSSRETVFSAPLISEEVGGTCPGCGAVPTAGGKFCEYCGRQLVGSGRKVWKVGGLCEKESPSRSDFSVR